MDKFASKGRLHELQRTLTELEQKEKELSERLDEVRSKKNLTKQEIDKIMSDDDIAVDVLSRVYEQRRSPNAGKPR